MNKMKKIMSTWLLALLAVPSLAQVSFGQAEKINHDWRFLRADSAWNVSESPQMKERHFDDTNWRILQLPHDWSVELPMSPDKGSCQGYLPGGVAWYRHHLQLPQPLNDKKVYVYFEGVYNHSEVYLNGHLLGKRPSGFASFLYDLTPWLDTSGDNVIAVRVDHTAERDARWYTGSGINRNVWLVTAPEVHLAPWGTAYRLNQSQLEVDVETTDCRTDKKALKLKAIVTLSDAGGHVVTNTTIPIGSQEKKTLRLNVRNARRWTLDDHRLYTLTTRLMKDGKQIDQSTVRAGLRTLQFSPDKGFALNGEWIKVKGVCVHDDAGTLGTAVPAEVWRRRIAELKAIGVNALRMSHNPHMPELYDLCDEMGMLVMDEASDEWEFPKRKWLKGWNKGRPGYEGTYTYFEEWIERDVADMVRRDRCHPSVFLWSIGNEVDYPNDPYSHPVLNGNGSDFTQPMYGGYKPGQPNAERIGLIAQRLSKVVKTIDTSIPVTGALAGVVMSNQTAYPQAVDVVGYNYTESRYETDHKTYPERIIYGSENRHDLAAWKAVSDHPHIFGQFLWTGIDYLGESGLWPARGSSAGLLDLAGQRKPNGWYRAALWSTQPTCYIGTYPLNMSQDRPGPRSFVSPYATDTWNYNEGDRVRIVCYTNAPSARLLLNGKPLSAELQRDPRTGILYCDTDYVPGTLRCEASNGATYDITTTGQPYALRLSSDGGMHVFVEIVDQEGRRVKTADHEVTLDVSGTRLLGMENGDIRATLPVRQAPDYRVPNKLRAYQGRLVAYIAPADSTTVTLRVHAPLLQSAELTLEKQE